MRQKPTSSFPTVSPAEHRALALWAAERAEGVLGQFERVRPGDARPREAIAAARAWVSGAMKMTEARRLALAAHAAARGVDDPAARAAARAAGHAAATAHVAGHAPHALSYARKAIGAQS